MKSPLIAGVYLGILALIYIGLTLYVVILRNKYHVSLGSGGHHSLGKAIRIHGNFAEYIPFIGLLFVVAEMIGMWSLWLNVIGVLLVFARLAHVWGLATKEGVSLGRFLGTATTLTLMLTLALFIIIRGFI